MIIEIDFDNRTAFDINSEIIDNIERAVIEVMKDYVHGNGYQISVSFVEDDEIRTLNKDYRDTDSVTDVLSFPMDDIDEREVMLLGDVVINLNKAKEQSEEFGHSFTREISYLTVHSVLHLLGYDHQETEDTIEMRSIEKEIMKKLEIYREDR